MNGTFRCSFCGHSTHFDEMDSCTYGPYGIHKLVADHAPTWSCMHCQRFTYEAAPGACKHSPFGWHEWT